MRDLRVVVAQQGAREHYAIARMCQRQNALACLYTDFWNHLPLPVTRSGKIYLGKRAQGFWGRCSKDIPASRVRSFFFSSILWLWKQRKLRGTKALYNLYENWGKDFATKVASDLDSIDHNIFFGFSSASLEALNHERKSGRFTVLDEIAPVHLEEEIIAEERQSFRGWESEGEPIPHSFLERMEQEWDMAHRIVVNSEWTKGALVTRGISKEKIFVVPLAYENPNIGQVRTLGVNKPLRVLWFGTLCLRKGFQYALEAARKLERYAIQFTFAGPTSIDLQRVSWPQNAHYLGQISRINAHKVWNNHDVLLLPTLSDGFAITQLEAMAHGLPVIATHNCGDIVEDGKNGCKINVRDSDAIVASLMKFLDREISLSSASMQALARVGDFSMDKVWHKLEQALNPNRVG